MSLIATDKLDVKNTHDMSASDIGPTTQSSRDVPKRIAPLFICNICGKSFKSDNELSLHKSLDHQ